MERKKNPKIKVILMVLGAIFLLLSMSSAFLLIARFVLEKYYSDKPIDEIQLSIIDSNENVEEDLEVCTKEDVENYLSQQNNEEIISYLDKSRDKSDVVFEELNCTYDLLWQVKNDLVENNLASGNFKIRNIFFKNDSTFVIFFVSDDSDSDLSNFFYTYDFSTSSFELFSEIKSVTISDNISPLYNIRNELLGFTIETESFGIEYFEDGKSYDEYFSDICDNKKLGWLYYSFDSQDWVFMEKSSECNWEENSNS